MSDLIHIISWERFCEKNNLNDLEKYAQYPMSKYPGLLDVRNLNTKLVGPLLQELPDNFLRILTEKSTLFLEHRNHSDSISGVDVIFKLLCLIARNNKNIETLKDSGMVEVVVRYMDVTMGKLVKEIDTDWLNLFEYLLYFLETVYDPTFSWRRRKKLYYSESAVMEDCPRLARPLQISNQIVTWICTQLNAFCRERDLRNRMLHLLCCMISGAKKNAQLVISPAIVDTFTFKSDVNAEIVASFCLLIGCLSEIAASERQEDLSTVVTKLLTFIVEKPDPNLHDLRCLVQLLDVNEELCEEVVRSDVFSVLERYLCHPEAEKDLCKLCFVILSKLTAGPYAAQRQFLLTHGYEKVLKMLTRNTSQPSFLLDQVFSWAVYGDFDAAKVSSSRYIIHDGYVVGLLVTWGTFLSAIADRKDSSPSVKTAPNIVVNWKAIFKLIMELCRKSRPCISKCCQSGVVSVICDCVKVACKRLEESGTPALHSSNEDFTRMTSNTKRRCEDLLNGLFLLLEMFSNYSISGNDLVSIIKLFKDPHSRSKGRRLIKLLNNIVSEVHQNHDVSCWFELYQPHDCISICPAKEVVDSPLKANIGTFQLDREAISSKVLDTMAWKISPYSFSFHCWLNLSPVTVVDKVNSGHERACIFRLLTEAHNGFEAFLNMDGQLLVATCHQGEFNYVQVTPKVMAKKSSYFLEENLLKLDKWYMLDLVFQNARNFFSKSTLAVYVDGVLVNTLEIKYPVINESISVFHIGGCPTDIPRELVMVPDSKSRKKTGFLSGGAPKRTWLGDEHNVWGRLSTLRCRMVTVACLNEALTEPTIATLFAKGPMNSQAIIGDEALAISTIVNFHAAAFDPATKSCWNLHPYIQSSLCSRYHCGHLKGVRLSRLKLEVVINEIGGILALLPIIEQLDFMQLSSYVDLDEADGYRFEEAYRFEDNSPTALSSSINGADERFISVSDNKSDEQLDDSIMASIVILVRKISLFGINQQQMERSKSIPIIGALLQKVDTAFLDMNVVYAFHALADQCGNNLSLDIYHWILLDWRIWARCSMDTRLKHCKFVFDLVKHERYMFRQKYGVGFFLDVIRLHHWPLVDGAVDSNRILRREIYGMIYSLVHKHATIGDYQKMVKFLHECKDDLLIQELLDLFTRLYDSSNKSDQDSLLLYESKLMESLFVLLIRELSIETKEDSIKFLHLIITSTRVPDKLKDHLLLADVSFASLFIYKEFYESPLSSHSISRLLDILRKAAVKDLFGVIQFLSLLTLSPIEQRISAMTMLKSFFDKSPDAIFAISQQPGWQDILIHLLVSKKRSDDDSNSPKNEMVKTGDNQLRTRDINSNITGFRRSSTWIIDDSLADNNSFTKSKIDEILEEGEDLSISNNMDAFQDENQEVKSVETLFLHTRSTESSCNTLNIEDPMARSLNRFREISICGSSTGSEDVENKEEQLIELTLECLHMVVWSVLDSASSDVAWMTVHQVMESLRSVNERYVMLKPMFFMKQKIMVALLTSTINVCRASEVISVQSLSHAKELIRLIVDSSYLISTEENYQYEIELFELTMVLLQDCLKVWEDDTLYPELAALGFYYLLTLSCSQDLDIVSAVCARLHQIITTISKNITYDEIAFILVHLDRVVKKVINNENYYFITPILKTVLEHHMDMLQISMYLGNLSIKTPEFYDYFKEYCEQLEWKTFIKTRLFSACEIYESSYLNSMTTGQSLWRAQANEQMSVDRKKRIAVSLEHKRQFETEAISMTIGWIKEERRRKEYKASELQSQHDAILKQWRVEKQFLTGSKGCWQEDDGPTEVHLKQSCRENFLRMRPRFEINYQFGRHEGASLERDHPCRTIKEPEPDPLKCLSVLEGKIDMTALGDDQLGDDEWTSIQNMEQTDINHNSTSSPKQTNNQKKIIFESRCKRITFTEVVDGKFELTNTHFIFQALKGPSDSFDCHNAKIICSINQIREVHLRRYNLRRSAIEIFLTDQTNYFFNFDTKMRDKAYSKILSLRPPNLVYSKQRSPADLLKNSNLTQKWVSREISNFEYLMQLNTIAGRTYNDMSQYHVFPWIIADYTSPKLDLTDPKTFRDLSKPIGVVNPKNENEVREKFEGFEDPSGVIAKFHYGTHYSSAAGVMHYMVRMEPFTTMHIQLQSGKFDVADRQFHSIPLAWSFIMESPSDNKELIPEFFYQPQFLKNENNFDFGLLQQTKTPIDDVELPAWASSPEDFIYQHRQALESEHVSMNLHHWIDLIFGYKQKGKDAVKALNVFYYVTYEGVVDLDLIEDPFERESIESMINNFGQTPCQLLKHPHPQRMSTSELRSQMVKVERYLPAMPHIQYLKHNSKTICSEFEPITFIRVPFAQAKSLMGSDRSLSMITVHSSNIVAKHTWIPSSRGPGSTFHIDVDSVFDSPSTRRKSHLGILSSLVTSNNQLYAVTPDCKFLLAGGNIENRLTVMSLSRKGELVTPPTPHHAPISCLGLDIDLAGAAAVAGQRVVGISGSLDSSCALWDWSDLPQVAVLHLLCGHGHPVSSVSVSVYLDVAATGARDGTVNLHSVAKGHFLHSISPGGLSPATLSVNFVLLGRLGHVYVQWHTGATRCGSVHLALPPGPASWCPKLSRSSSSLSQSSSVVCTARAPQQFLSLYSLHAHHIATHDLGHSPISVLNVVPRSIGSLDSCVIVGNGRGELSVHDGYDLCQLSNTLRFADAIADATLLSANGQYLGVALSRGQLIVSAVNLAVVPTEP